MKQLHSDTNAIAWKQLNRIVCRNYLILDNAQHYENLDNMMIELNLKCNSGLKDKIREYNENIKRRQKYNKQEAIYASLNTDTYLYMMKIYTTTGKFTDKVKIGISTNPDKRRKRLTIAWEELGLIFNIHKIGTQRIQPLALKAENIIHEALILINKQYQPSKKLDGWSEMFIYEEWMDNLIN